ncbi:hypothetical protein BDY24DRAFT_418047 [Mrakia frigida]|uniref:uncharacterized protein n=1 Tax=Mrakia frigida TaxID=29902 RepID=UPI003FCC1FEB
MSGLIHNSTTTTTSNPPHSPTGSSSSSPLALASDLSTNPTSPPSSLFELPPQNHQHNHTTPVRNQRSGGVGATAGTRLGPREKVKKVEEMNLEELGGTWERNQRVLGDTTIFPPLPPTSPPDPHQLKLLEAQSALEHRMSLLSTQSTSPPGSASPGSTSFGSRASAGGHGSPIPPNVTPSRRGLTAPLALNESLALQSSVYERERAREEARAEHVRAREMESEMARLSMVPGTAGGPSRLAGVGEGQGQGSGKLMDELERIRGQARMRAFMQPALPISRDPFYNDDNGSDFSDDDDDANNNDDEGDLLDVDDILGGRDEWEDAGGGDGNGEMMVISQEEVERGWVEDGRSGRGGSGMIGSGRRGNGNG